MFPIPRARATNSGLSLAILRICVPILNNLPAIFFFLIIAIERAYLREKQRSLLLVAGGLTLNLVAGLQQQIGFGIHPVYFNHNALYHVLQAIALYLFFLGSR